VLFWTLVGAGGFNKRDVEVEENEGAENEGAEEDAWRV
jgi:hypothetical protein